MAFIHQRGFHTAIGSSLDLCIFQKLQKPIQLRTSIQGGFHSSRSIQGLNKLNHLQQTRNVYREMCKVLEAEQITGYVWFLHGIVGGGILVFLPALVMTAAGGEGCCANRCGMMVTMVMSVLGAGGALFSMVISALGLQDGPLCRTSSGNFEYPFLNQTQAESYLFNQSMWSECQWPDNVVQWNITLFSILLALGTAEALLCLFQVINSLFGCLCGTCMRKRQTGVA
ncbi:hypothetical protein GJAV_G00054130 [Gymnothorax javanicus]|nr:hypothetical protein GJAV_G00054130 [Gymnothorax javanicus]